MKAIYRSTAALLACLHVAGCYTFREIARQDVRAGSNVRVMIQAEEAVRQQEVLGRLSQEVEGEVVAQESAETLGLTVAQPAGGPAASTSFNVFVALPWSSVLRVEEKRFNAKRTLAFAGAGAVLVIATLALDGGGTGGGDGGPGDDARVRIPLIRIPFR